MNKWIFKNEVSILLFIVMTVLTCPSQSFASKLHQGSPTSLVASSEDSNSLSASEVQIEAAYLVKFGKFVDWPASTADEVNLCILGSDPFGNYLDQMVSGKRIRGMPIRIVRISDGHGLKECQILFISKSVKANLAAILEKASGDHCLTVSRLRNFVDKGGMIQFFVESDRVRFYINVNAAQSAGIQISSKLLQVAKIQGAKPS